MDGSLNLDYHTKRLLLIAMGKYRTQQEQQKALGISRNKYYNLKKKYNL